MVHHRLNGKETNPNPHINFVSSLHRIDSSEQESARQLLRGLAAQVRPIMKSHGFSVNSLEEYEYNEVFAGRNWNAGETIELVLRRPNGTFLPASWLMSTLCHELAHIKHMNHGPDFQVLWKQLRTEVRVLQDKGYYGDGYWSSGTRLGDSAKVTGQGIEPGELPEYLCGGAQTRRRPTATRTRRPRKPRNTTITPSNSTGRQTIKPRKAGSRITSKNVFVGQGSSLMDDAMDGKAKGTGFGKRASSNRAREERALATERRLLALQNQTKVSSSSSAPDHVSETETDSDHEEVEIVETNNDRREALLTSNENEDLEQLKSGSLWESFENDFVFEPQIHSAQVSSSVCGFDIASGSTNRPLKAECKRKMPVSDDGIEVLPAPKAARISRSSVLDRRTGTTEHIQPALERSASLTPTTWACLVCTLENQPEHLACSVCATPRGEQSWTPR